MYELTESIDVGVVNLGSEEHFGGYERVFRRQEEFQGEKSSLVW